MNLINNETLRRMARDTLKGKWGPAVIMALIYAALTSGAGFLIEELTDVSLSSSIFVLFINGPIIFGFIKYFLYLVRGKERSYSFLFDGFSMFSKTAGLFILQNIIIFVGLILFIIPGIIFSLKFSLAFYVLNDNPDMKITKALEESSNLMDGNKMKLFLLQLSFLGWFLLSLLTFGIGTLFVVAYLQTATSLFYENLKGNI